MATNPYNAPAIESQCDDPSSGADMHQVAKARPSFWRYAIATFATVAFLYLGYLFLVSMRGRQWLEATAYLAGSLSAIPWVMHESRMRDCFAGSVVIAVGTLSAAASQVGYFKMFEYEWFNRIFNDKGAGEFGMMMFGSVAFVTSGYLCWRMLALVGVTYAPRQLLKNEGGSGEPCDEQKSWSRRF